MIFNTKESPFSNYENYSFTLNTWLNFWYPKICCYLGIDPQMDLLALQTVLKSYVSNYSIKSLKEKISGKTAHILAPGIRIESELNEYLSQEKLKSELSICIDGATSFSMSEGILPDIIVTDFDGKIEDQIQAAKQGSILLIHVHGDNLETVLNYLPQMEDGNFVITTQTTPLSGSSNFLGFTDGDRAVCFLKSMLAKEIHLLGFDFGHEIGAYSKQIPLEEKFKERKMKKFDIAKSVINWCAYNDQKIILFLA